MNALAEQIQASTSEDPDSPPEATKITSEDPDSIPLPPPEATNPENITNIADYIKQKMFPTMAWARFIPPNTSNYKTKILDIELKIENGIATIKNDGPMIIINTPDGEKPIKTNETLSFNINPNDHILWRKV